MGSNSGSAGLSVSDWAETGTVSNSKRLNEKTAARTAVNWARGATSVIENDSWGPEWERGLMNPPERFWKTLRKSSDKSFGESFIVQGGVNVDFVCTS